MAPSSEREESRDRELVLKHQPSISDSGRASVPMYVITHLGLPWMKVLTGLTTFRWDSSDPDRAPPPLPLNPGSSSPVAKPNTSRTIAAAAEALTAKARESAYTVNPPPTKSPEKSLIKGQHHKRFQSIQNSSGPLRNSYVDALGSLDRGRGPGSSPERLPRTPGFDFENRSPEKSPSRSETPTPSSRRPPLKAILGENTPMSSTMLALQNMPTPKETDSSLSDVTNSSTPVVRGSQTFDALSTQILSLTSIATNLQREMAQLSRRSKDNATDLCSLKEATNSRDEDIRKSLKDLAINLSSGLLESGSNIGTRNASNHSQRPGGHFLENKPYISPPGMTKSFSLPRIPSPNSMLGTSIDREISASPYNVEGAAGIALLEKIFREMGTKEGQEQMLSTLAELRKRPESKSPDPQLAKKLEEILASVRDSTNSRALVPRRDHGNGAENSPPKLELNFNPPANRPIAKRNITPQLATAQAHLNTKGSELIVNEEMQKILKKIKDSIAEGGGMTAEVKAHVRELRGEVLGMGRDIARRLDQAESTDQSNRTDAQGPGREEIAHIVQDGLAELRDHMEIVMREKRRQSSSSISSRRSVDNHEVYTAVKNALTEFPPQQQVALQNPGSGIEREEILEAVREAWETYKPEIELQNFGLEREEILQCLKEGLQDYQSQSEQRDLGGASYEEVLDAVREGLQNFKPPPIETEASLTKDEILMTVRECLETFDFPTSSVGAPREPEMTREDVLDAVKEGLSAQAPISKEIEFNRDDLFDAVKAGLEGAATPMGGVGEKVLDKMEDLIDGMRVEFKQYSVANGGDTEQVLDAMKDGLEVLRADIETYVDRASDVTGKDEIIDTVKNSLEHLRADLEQTIADSPRSNDQGNNGELLDAMEKEFEHLRQTIATSIVRSGGMGPEREEILDIIREGISEMSSNMPRDTNPDGAAQSIIVMKEEFEHIRETLGSTMVRGGTSADQEVVLEAIREVHESLRTELESKRDRPESLYSGTGELLDALNDGLDGLRADVERMVNKPIDMTVNYEILETLKDGLASVRADVDRLHTVQSGQRGLAETRDGEVVVADGEAEALQRNDIGNLEMMITQLRIKVEAMDNMPPPHPMPTPATESAIPAEQFEALEGMLRDVQASIADISLQGHSDNENAATKDDTEAIETLLRNTKAKLDEITSADSEGLARVAQIESIESTLNSTRDAINDFGSDGASKKDIGVLEASLKEVRAGVEEMLERAPNDDDGSRVSKTDIEALETLCMDTKTQIAELELPDIETLPTKAEVEILSGFVKTLNEQVAEQHELTAQAFDARKIEHGGLGDRIEDTKLLLEDVREDLKTKINEGHDSVNDIAQTLETLGETVTGMDATIAIKELMETLKRDFDTVHSASASAREEREQNHTILLGKHVEHKDAVITGLNSKVDERFDELMTKYDDAQLAAEEKERALGSKDTEQVEALKATRATADDLRLLVDTLGATVTESCDRMSEDSKTVFSRVEDVGLKIDNLLATDDKAEHQITRAEISKTLTSVEAVQAHASEYHPKILDAVKDVLSIVGQHYEQAQTATEEIKTSVNAIPGAIPLPAIAPPSPELIREAPVQEIYDDSDVHAKLDQLISHATEVGKSSAESEVLENIREQVAATASQLEAFVTAQRAAITENGESKAREAEEAAVALEKRTAQKEIVEADIVRLSEQKDGLATDVQDLLSEKDDLIALKSKMQADLSSLETALLIRREELHIMEARADTLERRILDGVLDHSRSLLTTSRPKPNLKDMNLKRVASSASNATATTRATSIATTVPSKKNSAVSSGIGMAMRRRQPAKPTATSNAGSKPDRRILSLSTLGANKGVGPTADRSMVLANPPGGGSNAKANAWGAGAMKRSHSVKSNFPSRKTSWNGTKAVGMYADDGIEEEDKENSVLDEMDEEDEGSEAGTERRTSYSGTYTGTGSYGEGSIMSSDDKRLSYEASTIGTVGTKDYSMAEDGNGESETESTHAREDEDEGHAPDMVEEAYPGDLAAAKGEISNASEMIVFGHPSDSGIGTDMPTAQFEGGSDYFKRG